MKNIYVIQKLLSERTQDIRVNAFGEYENAKNVYDNDKDNKKKKK